MVAARGRKRSALTDEMRARVFVRDRATCAFSGISLWLLDYGAAQGDEDWPDHILPVARKGTNELDNLVCASAEYNFAKRVNTTSNLFLYRCGLPTSAAYELFAKIPQQVARNLVRFKRLTESDWYFNRAVSKIAIHLGCKIGGEYRGTHKIKRQKRYWCLAALKKLQAWQKLVAENGDSPLEARGLVPKPMTADVRLLLRLRTAKSYRDVARIADALEPYARAGFSATKEFLRTRSAAERKVLLRRLSRNRLIPAFTLRSLKHNARVMHRFSACIFKEK